MTVTVDRSAQGRSAAEARVSPSLCLALAIGAIAIVSFRTWWSLVFVVYAATIALMDRRRSSASVIIGMALALGGPPTLVLASLFLVAASQYAPFPCGAG